MRVKLRTVRRLCCSCAATSHALAWPQVRAGHQVSYLKAWLHATEGLEQARVKLLHEGKELLDPLSFADYGHIISDASCAVEVQLR